MIRATVLIRLDDPESMTTVAQFTTIMEVEGEFTQATEAAQLVIDEMPAINSGDWKRY